MFRWYVINTYSGHENKVKHNIEHRVATMDQTSNIRQVIVLDVESTMTSCGYGVPVMEFVRHRGPEGRGRRYKE